MGASKADHCSRILTNWRSSDFCFSRLHHPDMGSFRGWGVAMPTGLFRHLVDFSITGRIQDHMRLSNWGRSNLECQQWSSHQSSIEVQLALPDGKTIICVSDDGHSRSVDSQTGQITEHATLRSTREFNSLNFSPTVTHFISINRTDTIEFSNITTFCEQSSGTCSRSIRSLAFSSNGRWMVSMHEINTFMFRVCLWDSQSGLLVWEDTLDQYDRHPVVAISPSGDLTVTFETTICRVRNTSLGTMISRWSTESGSDSTIAFSPDEKQIILEGFSTIETWDIESGTMVDSCNEDNDSSSVSKPSAC